MPRLVDINIRDHVRYTGDGLPGEPVNAPLPIGDPSSGVYHPTKKDIRDAIGDVQGDRIRAEEAAAAAEEAMLDVQGSTLYAGTLSSLLNNSTPSYPTGTAFGTRAEGFAYEVLPAAATDEDLVTAGGVKLRVMDNGFGLRLRAFGARGDGVTDDSAAVGKWLSRVIMGERAGFIDAGDYLLNSLVSLDYDVARKFTIRGAGETAARVIVPSTNTAGAFRIRARSRGNFARFSDFSIITRAQGGVGLWFEEIQGGNQHIITAAAWNLTIRGEDRTTHYFSTFLAMRGGFQTSLDNITIEGPFLGATASNYLDTSISYAAAVGIDIDGAYGPNLGKIMVQNVKVAVSSKTIRAPILAAASNGAGGTRFTTTEDGLRMMLPGQAIIISESPVAAYNGARTLTRIAGNTTQFDVVDLPFAGDSASGFAFHAQEPESFYLREPVFNQVDIGVDFVRYNGREPNFWINDGHINYRTAGIRVRGSQAVSITNMSIYNEDSAGVKPGNPIDIHLVDCLGYVITNNIFDFILTSPRRINVYVDNQGVTFQGDSGDHGIIANNAFKSGGQNGVLTSANTSNVIIGPNLQLNATYSDGLYRDISGADIVVTPEAQMSGTWTPALTFGGGSAGMAYASRSGKWTISGGIFHFEVSIALSAKGSATGTAEISLPSFVPGPKIPAVGGSVTWTEYTGMSGLSSANGRLVSAVSLRLTQRSSSSVTALTDANFTSSSTLTITGSVQMVPKA